MTIPPEMIEAVARAMCEDGGFDPDERMANGGPRWGYYVPGAAAAIRTLAPMMAEVMAEVADKRADDRFAEHGVTEYDTNASYYSGSRAEAYDELDEEDWAIAAAILIRGKEMADG